MNTATTHTVKIDPNAPDEYGPWFPTEDIRWLRAKATTTSPDKLQQKWMRHVYRHGLGGIAPSQEEWRDVLVQVAE